MAIDKKNQQVGVILPRDLVKRLDKLASRENLSRSKLIMKIIEYGIGAAERRASDWESEKKIIVSNCLSR